MRLENLTEDEMEFIESQIKDSPKLFLIAYAGTSFKEWKLVGMYTLEEFLKLNSIVETVEREYPSAITYKIYKVK